MAARDEELVVICGWHFGRVSHR